MKKVFAENIGVTLLMAGIALAATWPLAIHFFSAIPCQTTAGRLYLDKPGDQLQLLYWFWLFRDNLFGASGPTFMVNPYEFNMSASQVPSGPFMYPLYFLHLLFAPFLGDIAAYNCLVILSYILTGLFTYLLVKQYTGSRSGALLGALIYTLVPIRIINLFGGHLNGFIYYLLPAILYFFDRAVEKRSVFFAVLCGCTVFWLSLLEVHLIYYICVFLGIYIPFKFFLLPGGIDERNPLEFYAAVPGNRLQRWWPMLLLTGSGICFTIFYQGLSSWKFHQQFLSNDFWIILGFYPLIFIGCALFAAAVLARMFQLPFRNSVVITALVTVPFFLLPVYTGNLFWRISGLDKIVSGIVLLLSLLAGWYALQHYGREGLLRKELFRGRPVWQRLLRIVPAGIGLGLSVAWVLLAKKIFFAGSVAHGGRTIQDVKLLSPRLVDLYHQGSEVYLGIVPFLLIVYCLLVLFRQTVQREKWWQGRSLLLLSFFFFIFMLSYVLGAGLSFGSSSLYIFFFDHFPFFNYPRVPDRIMTIAFLSGAVLSGFALRDMGYRFQGRFHGLVHLLFYVFLVIVLWNDFGAGKPVALTNLDRGQSIYSYVKENIDDKLLLELPVWPGDSHQSALYEYFITLDGIRRVNGYTPIVTTRYIETVYKPLSTLNMGLLDEQQYQQLKRMGVRYITVHDNPDVFPARVSPFPAHNTVRRLMNSPYLQYIPLDNQMRLPGLTVRNDRLFLFRVVEGPVILDRQEKTASCRYFIPNVYDAQGMPHIIGTRIMDTTIGRQVLHAAADSDISDFLSYGPYETYSAGEYMVYFRMRAGQAVGNTPVARIDVAAYSSHNQQVLLAERQLCGKDFDGSGYQDFFLRFSLDDVRKLEFRTRFEGGADLWLEKIVLTCADQETFDPSYEAENLLGETGFLVQDKYASQGKAVRANVVSDPPGKMVFDPFRRYPAGRYRVTYFLKSDTAELLDPAETTVVDLSITTDNDATVLASRSVSFQDVAGQQYRPISLDMLLTRDNEVSFTVFFQRQADISVDRITIEYLGGQTGRFLPF